MKLTYDFFLTDVIDLLCVAATKNHKLVGTTLSKPEIKKHCFDVFKQSGKGGVNGWNDDLTPAEATTIEDWALSQARKYTW